MSAFTCLCSPGGSLSLACCFGRRLLGGGGKKIHSFFLNYFKQEFETVLSRKPRHLGGAFLL